MQKIIARFVMGISLVTLCLCANAQQLPKSGSISIHTNFSGAGVPGLVTGTAFNDAGKGPLHLGPANCSGTFFMVGAQGKGMGFCTFGDADGDRFFVQYTGDYASNGESNGINEIIGGSGKYIGVQGKGPFKCKPVGVGGEIQCTETFDYQLPKLNR